MWTLRITIWFTRKYEEHRTHLAKKDGGGGETITTCFIHTKNESLITGYNESFRFIVKKLYYTEILPDKLKILRTILR